MPEPVAGWTRGRGPASFLGVLREGGREVWRCPAQHAHMSAVLARRHAEEELERRRQAGREVVELYACDPCGIWYDHVPAGPDLSALQAGTCPRCGVPVQFLRVLVLEREASVR